jgi:tetratricopeptide (TPR) repeat protein
MRRQTFRRAALVWVASLVILPDPITCAVSLREEAVTYRIQGYEAQRRGDKAAARSLYQKAAQLDPAYPTPHNDVGVLLEQEGLLEEAEQSYKQALALNPAYPDAHANLAMLYERMGEKEKAVYHWMKRYQLGDAADPWTSKAEDRLVALGALSHPTWKGMIATRHRLVERELQSHAQSLEEFHTLTGQHGDWQ